MRYNVTHITEYFYSDPVPLCHNLAHLKPRDTARQTLLSYTLQVTPNPLVRAERVGGAMITLGVTGLDGILARLAAHGIESQPNRQCCVAD